MISVIVSIYKNLENLNLVLLGLEKQIFKDFEVIISEDNDSPVTAEFIKNAKKKYIFPIKHVSQEDIGFRKTQILNIALLAAQGEYLVFLDGDCIPHKCLLESYNDYLTPVTVCMGRRCYLDKTITEKLYRDQNLKHLNFFNIILHSKRPELGIYLKKVKPGKSHRPILGCNWGISRQVLIDINGFDEDYIHPGVGEDHDLDWRLRLIEKLEFINIKYQVIVYHLYHKLIYTPEMRAFVNAQKDSKVKIGNIICKNGIRKIN